MYVNTDLSSVALKKKKDFHFYFHGVILWEKKNLLFFQNSDHITCQVIEASLVNINQIFPKQTAHIWVFRR